MPPIQSVCLLFQELRAGFKIYIQIWISIHTTSREGLNRSTVFAYPISSLLHHPISHRITSTPFSLSFLNRLFPSTNTDFNDESIAISNHSIIKFNSYRFIHSHSISIHHRYRWSSIQETSRRWWSKYGKSGWCQ